MSEPVYLYYFHEDGDVKVSHEPPYREDLQAIDALDLVVIRVTNGVAEQYDGSGFTRPAEVSEIVTHFPTSSRCHA